MFPVMDGIRESLAANKAKPRIFDVVLRPLVVQPEGVAGKYFRAMATLVISVGMPPFDVRSDGKLGCINVWALRAGDVEFRTVESKVEGQAEHGRIGLA